MSKQTTKVVIGDKSWRLPLVLPFWRGNVIKKDHRFYDVIGFRPPRKGEYYLSGGPVEAWKVLYDPTNDFTTPYLIVIPGEKAVRVTRWVRESEV